MYSNCLFCPTKLGANRELEAMPVGRRLAFDPTRGRLWVVCPRCGRWNLCPFDERWEALEACERLARTSLLRESTAAISLLEHRAGLSLIRVGAPKLAELVSWRFARSLVRRRRGLALAGIGFGTLAATSLLGMALGGGGAFSLLGSVGTVRVIIEARRPVIDMTTVDGVRLRITAPAARGAFYPRDRSAGPALRVRTQNAGFQDAAGADMAALLARVMPFVNETGGSADLALAAAAAIAERGGAEGFLESVGTDRALHRAAVLRRTGAERREGAIYRFPRSVRLGLEAASHMQQEDRVLSGELSAIVEEWRAAEELAEISDGLLAPPGWASFRAEHREGPEEDQ